MNASGALALSMATAGLIAFIAPACGLAPHDERTPEPRLDGLSGFRQVGAVELCFGRRRVIPPSVAPTEIAVCIPDGVEPATCTDDSECGFPARCLCGRCAVVGCSASGVGCDEGRVCRSGRCTVQCQTDADCAELGLVCDAGGCARPCTDDAQCGYGELCDSFSDACRTKLCDPTRPCAAGTICEPLDLVGEVHEPYAFDVGDTPFVYLDVRSPTESTIRRVRLTSAARWQADPEEPVLSPADPTDAGRVESPALVREGDHIALYFSVAGGAAIHRATSTDGVTFTRAAEPVLVAEPSGWEAGRVASASIAAFRGERYLVYEGGQGAGIGIAILEADGERAQRLSDTPALTPALVTDDVFWRHVDSIGTPHAVVAGDVLRIYFTGRGLEGTDAISATGTDIPADPNPSIGVATTRHLAAPPAPLTPLTPFPTGPVFARRSNLRVYLGESDPHVSLGPTGADLLFVSSDSTGARITGISRARAR